MASYLKFTETLTPETPEAAHADDVANVSAQTLGAKSANLFSGFTDSGLTVLDSGGNRYVQETAAPSANYATLISTDSRLDCEVSVKAAGCTVFLRYDSATGSGYVITAPLSGSVTFTAVHNGLSLNDAAAKGTIYSRPDVTIASRPAYSSEDLWTFGYVGFEVYAKFNGVEFARFREYLIGKPGRTVIAVNNAVPLLGNCSIKYFPQSFIGSNRPKSLFDIRDLGAKTTMTTGSMTEGSYTLNVASASGLAVGDEIIVRIGGEAGLGYRGTEGVGGVWPPRVYATLAAMNADTTQAADAYCWNREDGFVYLYRSAVWTKNIRTASLDTGVYYTEKALPYSLRATITAIAGTAITLNQPAVVATTGASVYVDCYRAFLPITDAGTDTSGKIRVQIPVGRFALGKQVVTAAGGKTNLHVFGQGLTSVLFSPRGVIGAGLILSNSPDARVRSFDIEGNHVVGASGEVDGFQFVEKGTDGYPGWTQTLKLSSSSHRGRIHHINLRNVLSGAIVVSNCTDTWAYNCTLTQDHGALAYTQWYMQQVDSFGGGFVDCTVNGTSKLIKAFESFNCYPDPATGIGTTYLRCGGQNALLSFNGSPGMQVLEWDSTVTTDSYGFLNAGFFGEAILNVSSNAYHSAVTGLIRNPRIRQLGYCRTNDQTSMYAIQVSLDCFDVIIEGEYAGTSTPFSDALGGYISAPDFVDQADNSFRSNGSTAIIDEGTRTVIRGIRAVGATNPSSYKSIDNTTALVAGTIENNIADTFGYKAGTTKSGNRTNAGVAVP